jgi:arylsulfatase A-like enzyme
MMPQDTNILLIVTDQHRIDAVGCYDPDSRVRTPHIDRLAAEGVRFTRAYTTCPLCSPARASIMTGQYPHRSGVTENIHAPTVPVSEILDTPDTLPRRLLDAGYRNGFSGKWHLGAGFDHHDFIPELKLDPALPTTRGFEGQDCWGHGGGGHDYPEYDDYLSQRGLTKARHPWEHDAKNFHGSGVLKDGTEASVPHWITQHTLDLITNFQQQTPGNPWFYWHNFWGPHGPFIVSQPYLDLYADTPIPPWRNFNWPARATVGPHRTNLVEQNDALPWADWETSVRYYYAFTTMIDDQIGRMIQHLETTGQLVRTVIIFTADHGELLGSHGGIMNKGYCHWDDTHRIPLIIRFPNGSHAGTTWDEHVSLADLMPTVLDLADAKVPDSVQGRSLLPLLNDQLDSPWRDAVVTEFNGLGGTVLTMRTVRKGDLKYGYNAAGFDDELYDLSIDPHETRNLINHPAYQNRLADCRETLWQWMVETRDPANWMYAASGRALHDPTMPSTPATAKRIEYGSTSPRF